MAQKTKSFADNNHIEKLCSDLMENSKIDPRLYEKFHVKRGLRRSDGTGVIAGITNICNVHGYIVNEGEREPMEGELIYRGYNIGIWFQMLKMRTDTVLRKLYISSFSVNFRQLMNLQALLNIWAISVPYLMTS